MKLFMILPPRGNKYLFSFLLSLFHNTKYSWTEDVLRNKAPERPPSHLTSAPPSLPLVRILLLLLFARLRQRRITGHSQPTGAGDGKTLVFPGCSEHHDGHPGPPSLGASRAPPLHSLKRSFHGKGFPCYSCQIVL